MNKKETIEHFIKWYCYITKNDYNKNVMLKILDNYIKNKHYNFSPFKNKQLTKKEYNMEFNYNNLTNDGKLIYNNLPQTIFAFYDDMHSNEIVQIVQGVKGYMETSLKANTVEELMELNKVFLNDHLTFKQKVNIIDIMKRCSMFPKLTEERTIMFEYSKAVK